MMVEGKPICKTKAYIVIIRIKTLISEICFESGATLTVEEGAVVTRGG
jgi:hypothetical protein